MNINTDKELYNLAKKRVYLKRSFDIHVCIYAIISLMLIFISLFNGSAWFVFPVFGWGAGVLLHKVFLDLFLNFKSDIEKEVNSLKKQNKI